MQEEKEISQAVVRRMPRYYRHLGELLEDGVERISSNDLSQRMNVTASQIRQDLNNFGGFGQQGYGYNVKYLHDEIGKVLGLNRRHNIIVVGAGNLGQALANYVKFEKHGFVIIGLFDVNPALDGNLVRGIRIHMLDELEAFCAGNRVDIAALTMPKEKADAVANRLVDLGIHAIWNFAHVDLELIGKDVVVENVHLSDSLMQLSYNIVKNQSLHAQQGEEHEPAGGGRTAESDCGERTSKKNCREQSGRKNMTAESDRQRAAEQSGRKNMTAESRRGI